MPKIADKNYTEKRLEILDEGERHIELIALFKTYAINLSILILAIVVIGLYSITTGINQSFSLLLIIAIFIYNAFSYLLKRRRFLLKLNKEEHGYDNIVKRRSCEQTIQRFGF